MSPAVLQRQAALVGAALLAGLLVVVLDKPARRESAAVPPPVSQAQWETALVWVARARRDTACGTAAPGAPGVVHPVLPCGVKVVVSAHGKELRTEVVGQGPVPAGRDFGLTPALAAELGVRDRDRVRWRFAG